VGAPSDPPLREYRTARRTLAWTIGDGCVVDIDIDGQTLSALDGAAVLAAIAERARTGMGRRAALALPLASTASEAVARLDLTEEALRLEEEGGSVPVGGIEDVGGPIDRAVRHAVLEKDELRQVARALDASNRLADALLGADEEVPALKAIAPRLQVDRGVVDALAAAFDETGELSARTYPVLGELRERVAGLHHAIRRTLEDLVKGDTLADALQDRFVTQRGDRYVLPIKANWKRKELGIVHAVSGSGQTAFVEPHAVVELNNDLRLAEGELEATERRILAHLSGMVGRVGPSALDALDAATTVDLAVARATLARDLDATRPKVGEGEAIVLRSARHPLLVLRGLDVVANDLELTTDAPVLVVSGPNTGGKTVALKTVGLAALLVRLGCFVPAEAGSRVDVFRDVVALVGDHQTVQGDQSSFSSHVAVLREMLARSGRGALFLVDEIASGTDPEQGSALAHAVVERFVETGARALVTTHFQRLKALGAADPRVATAGMQFERGRPTYRLVRGATGESHALEVAERIGIEPVLIARARALMDQGERDLHDALASLDRERLRAAEATRRADELAAAIASQTARLAEREEALARRARELDQKQASAFLDRLASAEKAIGAVVADLQRAPSHAKVQAARATLDALRGLAPSEEGSSSAPPPLAPGDRVRLPKVNDVGEVVSLGKLLTVRTSRGLTMRVDPGDVVRLGGPVAPPEPRPVATREKAARGAADAAVRVDANTLDLRGLRVDEGLEEVERFLDRMIREDRNVVFLLHGHGTGAMKQAVRQFLPRCRVVASWAPAPADQGGDAYTMATLR
jgi:DNA mismatch repair protein MutS2